jgi:hypothetical protein
MLLCFVRFEITASVFTPAAISNPKSVRLSGLLDFTALRRPTASDMEASAALLFLMSTLTTIRSSFIACMFLSFFSQSLTSVPWLWMI